jgi:hypothetical protein
MLHHGVQDGDDVGEEGSNGQKARDEGAVRLIACGIKMRIKFGGRWKAGG